MTVRDLIKANQRLMLAKWRGIFALQRPGAAMRWNNQNVTEATVSELRRQVGELLKANAILRGHIA